VQSLRRRCAAPAACDSVPFAAYGAADLTDRSYAVGMLMFFALYQTLGAEAFDRTYRGFFQGYRDTGAGSAELVAAFRAASPRSARVLADWFFTTRWYARLAAGESVRSIVEGYKH
jgi:aminopeptidase N